MPRKPDAVQWVERCLERIDRYDEQVRAWVTVDWDGARRTARQRAAQASRGEILGPLHGVPLGVKDIFDVAGMPTEAGSPIRRGWVAERDAPIVAALRRQGAIILGKTVTTEFACFDPSPTANPWNLLHSPGGSSSGSAAAVAMGMCWAALGSQTGGSISRPASYCGVVGFKPTWSGRPLTGVVPVSFHLDHLGPLARRVEPVRRIAAALLQEGWWFDMGSDLTRRADQVQLGLLQDYFLNYCDDQVRAQTQAACDQLQRSGVAVQTVALPPSFEQVHAMHRRIMAVEAAQYHAPWFDSHRGQYGRHIASLIEEGRAITTAQYVEALQHRLQFQFEMCEVLSDVDALLCPTTPRPAPDSHETTGDPSFNSPWSYAGLPTITLPCGLSPSDGMPCGIQLIGRLRDDLGLLSIAAICETILAFEHCPTLLQDCDLTFE